MEMVGGCVSGVKKLKLRALIAIVSKRCRWHLGRGRGSVMPNYVWAPAKALVLAHLLLLVQ